MQVLNNLLSNGARHSSEFLPIRISAVRDGAHVALSVTDEGRGLSADQLPHVFRKHRRVGGVQGGIGATGRGCRSAGDW